VNVCNITLSPPPVGSAQKCRGDVSYLTGNEELKFEVLRGI